MKIKLILIPKLILALLIIGGSFAVSNASVSAAPSQALIKECHERFNGKNINSAPNYADSKCPEAKGGSCHTVYPYIECTAPRVNPSPSPSPSGNPIVDDSQCPADQDETTCVRNEPNDNKCDIKKEDVCNPVKDYLNPFIKVLTLLVGLAVVAGIIWGGIQYSMSAGDPQKSSTAKNHIRNSIVALIVYLLLFALLRFLVPGTDLISG